MPTNALETNKGLPTYQELLDAGSELSFPCSDPPAYSLCSRALDEVPTKQQILDEAVELSFPCSDPIAVSSCDDVSDCVDWRLPSHAVDPCIQP